MFFKSLSFDEYICPVVILLIFLFLQVSVGTLLAFTVVAVSVLILRYVPPVEVPLPSSLQESSDSFLLQCDSSKKMKDEDPEISTGSSRESSEPLLGQTDVLVEIPMIARCLPLGSCKALAYFITFALP